MINNNKILTVSYGTFSCTLEGFDDSFGTMKAIAEYFRDLAADDRYFGAEPPQPDAQMLARIAQREISRHVEARQDEGRIVLSAKETPQAAALVASGVVEDVASAVADASDTKAELAPEDIAPVTAEAAPVETPAPQAPVETAAPAPAAPEEEISAPAAQDAQDIVPSLPDSEVEAFFAESPAANTDDYAEAYDAAEDMPSAAPDTAKTSSIADKLKRIRAVVSQQADEDSDPDYSEDQHADAKSEVDADAVAPAAEAAPEMDLSELGVAESDEADSDYAEEDEDGQDDVLAHTLRDLEDALDADDALEPGAEAFDDDEVQDEDEDDNVAAILNRLETEAEPADLHDEEAMDEDTDDDLNDSILAAMDGSDEVDDADADNLFDADDDIAADDEEPAHATEGPRTRVLKIKRATLEAAIQSGKLEEYDDEDEDEETAAEPLRKAPLADRSTLSDEAEEDLARELAELEADMSAEDDEAEAASDDEEEVQETAPQAEIHGAADADFSRLMDETDNQMDEPESATRRDAFAHLRAAVAAKKADEAVGGTDRQEEETDEAYRDDLANVVRPRRPVAGDRPRSERPSEQRPAPLKLVAEQRIDVQPPTGAPVRPRRVAAVAPDVASVEADATSFADFASEMGAEKLPDLLEAAAAYLSFVEGHEKFSRPQLMSKVRQVEQENFTREDSLRSFGKLLREGKIEKLKGGRFQASDQIGFKPAARAAG